MYPTAAYKSRARTKASYRSKGGAHKASNFIKRWIKKRMKARFLGPSWYNRATTLKNNAKNFARKLVTSLRR